jgi:hypothetical protein
MSSSPINFEWVEDPFLDCKVRDVLDPVAFIDPNDVTLEDEPLEFPVPPRELEISTSNGADENSSNSNRNENTNNKRCSESRKRSLSSATPSRRPETAPVSRRKKKPKGMPKRPLSAYNLYFQSERTQLLAAVDSGERRKIGFEGLGKIIGKKWRELNAVERKVYDKLAEKDSVRYRKEMESYHEKQAKKIDDDEKLSSYNFAVSSSLDQQGQAQLARAYEPGMSFHEQAQPKQHPESFMVVPVGHPLSSASQQQQQQMQMEEFDRLRSIPSNPISQVGPPPSYTFAAQADLPQAPYQQAHYEISMQHQQPPPLLNQMPPLNQMPQPPNLGHHISLPPPQVMEPGSNDSFPMPPGMEIVLSDRNGKDRKYRVQYTCYSMTRDAAHKYIESMTGAAADGRQGHAPPAPPNPG